MEEDNGWTVKKYTKTVLVVGTPLYLMWTDEHQKLHPKCTFEGNVRIAITQYIANGFIFMVFKDNSVRKIHMCDEEKVGFEWVTMPCALPTALDAHGILFERIYFVQVNV